MKRVHAVLFALAAAAPFAASAQYGSRYDDSRYQTPQVLRCESKDHRSQVCRVDTRGGVRIVRQESDASCVAGRTWGYDDRGIWVTGGCRGRFEVGGGYAYGNGYDHRYDDRYDNGYDDRYDNRYNNGYGVAYSSRAQVVTCESRDERQHVCGLPYGARSVRIHRQLSRTNCSQGYNWGTTRGGVWVDRGCRAEFAVY